jgi:hypothetical protein
VIYLEESGWSYSCYDPASRTYTNDERPGLNTIRSLLRDQRVQAPAYYLNRQTGRVDGTTWSELKRILEAADLLLNIGGVCWLPEFSHCRRLALIDMDPFFTQVGRFAAQTLHEYHRRFSYGVNVGQPSCTVPVADLEWAPTVPPVVPELWRGGDAGTCEVSRDAPFTTVASWRAYGAVEHEGEHFGQKGEEFDRLLDLPRSTRQRLELAISGGGEEATRERYRAAGWSVRDGEEVSADLSTYQSYVIASRGELSAAKNAYVKTRSGWFSDRSACYLAAGRPAVLQETGFSEWLPADRGLLPFSSLEEAAVCLERINADYAAHSRAARKIADATFDYRVVLPGLLERTI